jgi:formylglycine-generating enzyme required for sulfatase activity
MTVFRTNLVAVITCLGFSSLAAAEDSHGTGRHVGMDTTVVLLAGTTMEFVWIEPGTFVMGSPEMEEGRAEDEGPQHEVKVSRGFWLGKYEVTQQQWEAVTKTRPWEGKEQVQVNPDNPAVYISWEDAHDFINRLNSTRPMLIYRLPTEAEWEYAARAGTTTRWSFGDEEALLGEYAWYKKNMEAIGEKYAHAVGEKKPNPWGLFDMHGNVYEWVQDGFEYYTSDHRIDPIGHASPLRMMRHGVLSSADRGKSWPTWDPNLGVRLLMTALTF